MRGGYCQSGLCFPRVGLEAFGRIHDTCCLELAQGLGGKRSCMQGLVRGFGGKRPETQG